MIGSATSSSWRFVSTGLPVTSEFCGNEPSGCCWRRTGSRARGVRLRGRRRRSARSRSRTGRATTPSDTDRSGSAARAPGPRHRRRRDERAAEGLVLAGREHHRRVRVLAALGGAREARRRPLQRREVRVPARGVAAFERGRPGAPATSARRIRRRRCSSRSRARASGAGARVARSATCGPARSRSRPEPSGTGRRSGDRRAALRRRRWRCPYSRMRPDRSRDGSGPPRRCDRPA